MITIYFAPPGVGKTTLAARFVFWEWVRSKFHRNKYSRVLCNFPCIHSYEFDTDMIGSVDMSDSLILIDEIGISMNNRKWADMSQDMIKHLKLHRHYKEDIIGFSQSYQDMDITVKRLATEYRLLKKCWFWPYTVKALRITKTISIDDNTHEIVDAYQFDPWYIRFFTTKRYYLPLYWHMFDSWEAPKLPKAVFRHHT